MNPSLLPLGMFGRAIQPAVSPLQQPLPQPAPQKPSFFGQGGAGRAIAGNIGDFLLQQSGMRPIYAPAIQSQHEAALQQAQAEQQRNAGMMDWMAKEKWKRENPEPVNNDTIADYDFRVRTLGKAAADDWLKSASDPVVTVTLPGNRVYSGPRSGLAAALGGGAQTMQRPEIGAELPDPRKRGGAGPGQPTFQPSAVMGSLIQQESGGRAGVLGPQTRYGQAQGLTQMLPATAESVAKKLGVPWRPDLMTGTSKAAAAYQRALGQAYLEEGYQATGNIRDALHYYHGGPSRKLWGPKTRGYAESVISRMRAN